MTRDVDTLTTWIICCLFVAAVCTTAVPMLYSRFAWKETHLGRVFMVQSAAFAIVVDLTLIFHFWQPHNILVLFWIHAGVFTLIAVSTAAVAIEMWRLNHRRRK